MKVYNSQSFCFVLILFYIGFLSIGSGSLFSSFLLCKIIDITYCIAMLLIWFLGQGYQCPNWNSPPKEVTLDRYQRLIIIKELVGPMGRLEV